MDIHASIQWATAEIERLPPACSWRDSVLTQLRYCAAVAEGSETSERLEQLTMGWIVSRELDGHEPTTLQSTVSAIQYALQRSQFSICRKGSPWYSPLAAPPDT